MRLRVRLCELSLEPSSVENGDSVGCGDYFFSSVYLLRDLLIELRCLDGGIGVSSREITLRFVFGGRRAVVRGFDI
jgi:hypothetical protein